MKSMYKACKNIVGSEQGEENWVEIGTGVRHWSFLSPLSFILYMDKIMTVSCEDITYAEDLLGFRLLTHQIVVER